MKYYILNVKGENNMLLKTAEVIHTRVFCEQRQDNKMVDQKIENNVVFVCEDLNEAAKWVQEHSKNLTTGESPVFTTNEKGEIEFEIEVPVAKENVEERKTRKEKKQKRFMKKKWK